MTKAWLLPLLLPGLVVAACSSSGGGTAGSDNMPSSAHDASADAPPTGHACGLAFFVPESPTCQAHLDGTCCNEEKRCAASQACAALVACVDACPVPRTDACVNACAGPTEAETPGYAELNAIAVCSHSADAGNAPASCNWPQ